MKGLRCMEGGMRYAEGGPLAAWAARPSELLHRPRRVEPLRAGRKAWEACQATVQQTMPDSVRQPTASRPTPPSDLEALTVGMIVSVGGNPIFVEVGEVMRGNDSRSHTL